MRKYQFNNLYDSIIITILLIVVLFLLSLSVCGNYLQGNMFGIICCSCLFGSACLVLVIIILFKCYERWYIDDEKIIVKHLLHKKCIARTEILDVRKEHIRTLLNYSQEAYIITDNVSTIIICVSKKNKLLLQTLFEH